MLRRVVQSAAEQGAIVQPAAARLALQALADRFSSAAAEASSAAATLVAEPRGESGRLAAKRLRKEGKTPGMLLSLPGERSQALTFDAKELETQVHRLGRTRWACTLFDVHVAGAEGAPGTTYRALGRQVHRRADTDEIENVTLLHCPPGRRVRVDVPLQVFGEEVCAGIKAGGRLNWIKRTIACVCSGDAIPAAFEIDISHLELNQKLLHTDLAVPQGVALLEKNLSLPVLKIQK